jgi:hypothetical protein
MISASARYRALKEDFAELWALWFGLADSSTIVQKLNDINDKYDLGLSYEVDE